MADIIFKNSRFTVTENILKTPRRTYDLKKIEYVSLQQPLLVILGVISVGMALFGVSFHRYLYPWEIASIIAGAVVCVVLAATLGSLKVHSLALRENEAPLFGNIRTLRQVKNAVEEVISNRE